MQSDPGKGSDRRRAEADAIPPLGLAPNHPGGGEMTDAVQEDDREAKQCSVGERTREN